VTPLCEREPVSQRKDDWWDEVRLPAALDSTPPGGPRDNSLHVDTDALCPRCLTWIQPGDYVRQNAMDLMQHESCPRGTVPSSAPREAI
jgi:hypothetical protein